MLLAVFALVQLLSNRILKNLFHIRKTAFQLLKQKGFQLKSSYFEWLKVQKQTENKIYKMLKKALLLPLKIE